MEEESATPTLCASGLFIVWGWVAGHCVGLLRSFCADRAQLDRGCGAHGEEFSANREGYAILKHGEQHMDESKQSRSYILKKELWAAEPLNLNQYFRGCNFATYD